MKLYNPSYYTLVALTGIDCVDIYLRHSKILKVIISKVSESYIRYFYVNSDASNRVNICDIQYIDYTPGAIYNPTFYQMRLHLRNYVDIMFNDDSGNQVDLELVYVVNVNDSALHYSTDSISSNTRWIPISTIQYICECQEPKLLESVEDWWCTHVNS